MILLVDAGNTRIKWAGLENGALQSGAALLRRGGADDIEVLSASWGGMSAPARVLVASVAGPGFRGLLTAWSRRCWGVEPEFICSQPEGFGVTNAYPDPRRLGVDRWLALIAAHRAHTGPVCVIDCGTALTIDAVAEDGVHLGGLIMPGLGLMRRSLLDNTADIRAAALEGVSPQGKALLANDTHGAVMGGTLYAAVAAIERIMRDLGEQIEGRLTCLLTGGDSDAILPLLSTNFELHHEPDLVLQGLAIVAETGR